MSYPAEYIDYLVEFHGSRDYFECHEILEEYWKEVSPGERDSHWVGFIQLAVALYHQRRGNFNGAAKTIKKAREILSKKEDVITELGMNPHELLDIISSIERHIHNQTPYQSITLPLTDTELIKACQTSCKNSGFSWCMPSNLNNAELIHRHTLRDRTEVIQERNRQLRLRRENPQT